MTAIFWRVVKNNKIAIIAYSLSGFAFLWLYFAIFPSLQSQSQNYSAILQSLPPALLKIFGMISNSLSIENLLSAKHFSLVWPIMAIFLVASYGGNTLAGEIEKGTLELLLALPISRIKLFFSKYYVGLVGLVIFVIFSILTAIPLAELYHFDYNINSFLMMGILGLLFAWSIYALTIFFSSVFDEKGKVFSYVGSILIVMYVLNIIALLKDNLVNLKYFSFFYYFDYTDALMNHHIGYITYLLFIGVIVIFTLLGSIYFSKRDIAV